MYRQHSVLHHHFGVARVALVQVEMMRAEAVKEKLVKFVLLGKLLYALSQFPLTRCESEEVHKFKEHRGDCIIPHTNHTFNSYFHINVVLGVMLCRFHPLTDKVGVLVHKVYDALVIFGVLVVLAVALHHFEGSQVHLYGFNNLIANPCR